MTTKVLEAAAARFCSCLSATRRLLGALDSLHAIFLEWKRQASAPPLFPNPPSARRHELMRCVFNVAPTVALRHAERHGSPSWARRKR